jgi:hypothetical protein
VERKEEITMNNYYRNNFINSVNLRLTFLIVIVSIAIFSTHISYGAFEFTPSATLNTNADTDSGGDGWPQIATDGSGNWVAVWASGEDLGATAGTDGDIFVSTSSFTPVNSWQLF